MTKRPPISIDDKREALRIYLASPEFRSAPRLADFLSYVTEESIAGRAGGIKAYAIGIDVLEKPDDFDPTTDPIVRVSARRLRAALKGFHESDAGRSLEVIISVPLGGYAPTFSYRDQAPSASDLEADRAGDVEIEHQASSARSHAHSGVFGHPFRQHLAT